MVVYSSLTLVALLTLMVFANRTLAEIVYDNSAVGGTNYFPASSNYVEFGDEVNLAGINRIVTEFAFEYFGDFTAQGDEQGRLRFYKNTGPEVQPGAFAPSTLLFDSGFFPVFPDFQAKFF